VTAKALWATVWLQTPTSNPQDPPMQPDLLRDKSKSPARALGGRLEEEVGLTPAQRRITLDFVQDYTDAYFDEFRAPGAIVHTAVAIHEPPGKPIKNCQVVPVRLTHYHESDPEVQRLHGTVQMRMTRLYRMCVEAKQQRGLLSYEDLAYLLCVNTSTIRDLVARLREMGLSPPTRGAVKDIGPEPSHKREIATLLGQGFSTSQIASLTNHSEGAIGRYQADFGLVLHLLHTYPDEPDGTRRQLANLRPKAWVAYVEVATELARDPACQPHLARLRRRYEMDLERVAGRAAPGKTRPSKPASRLPQQNLGTAIRQTVQEDLALTQRVAEAVADDVMALVDEAFVVTEDLRPGEVVVFADKHDPSFLSGERTEDRPVMPVRLPVHTAEAQERWRADEPVGRRRARVAVHMADAAAAQGAVMTVDGLAELLHVSPGTLGKNLRELAIEVHVTAPTKGLIEDSGPTLTHKDWIVGLDQCGLTGEEITWLTRHAPASRDRYIESYRRAEALMQLHGAIPDVTHLARILHLRPHVAAQYVELLERFHRPGELAQDNAPDPDIPF